MTNIFWSTDSHEISWLVIGKLWSYKLDHITNESFTLANTDSSHSDTISRILRQEINRLLSEIQIGSSLDNRKQDTTCRIIFFLKVLKCSLGPTMRHLHLLLHNFLIGFAGRTDIQYHHNI